MKINCHAHIFNLATVASPQSVAIINGRIRRHVDEAGLPSFVADAVENLIKGYLKNPEYLTDEEIERRLFTYIWESRGFKRYLRNNRNLPVQLKLLGRSTSVLRGQGLRFVMERFSSFFDDKGAAKTSLSDILATLRIVLQPTITNVAETLLSDLDPDDVAVALMMDITTEETFTEDRSLLMAQMKGTSRAMVAFPGRIIPFVAVNTRREDYYEVMRKAIEDYGFAGIKLYPSLGSPVDSDEMKKVYRYCVEHELPILMHCNQGGFYEKPETQKLCDPAIWEETILPEFPDLRICFAHAGGLDQGMLTPQGPKEGQWAYTLERLIKNPDYGHVYLDLSFHADQMGSDEKEKNYLKWLRRLLNDDQSKKRVLFGTDYWLLRMNVADPVYWAWYEANLTKNQMKLISCDAPRRYLGLPDGAGRGMKKNIQNLVEYLEEQESVGDEPASWLSKVSNASFTVSSVNPVWSENNFAHRITYIFMRRYMTSAQEKIPFNKAGELRLRQLTYWNKEQVSEKVFKNDLRSVAMAFHGLCTGSDGEHKARYDEEKAIEKLEQLLGNGEKKLFEAGLIIDSMFHFTHKG